jgi:hypothetical protein
VCCCQIPVVFEFALARGPVPLSGGADTVLRAEARHTGYSERGHLETTGQMTTIR